MPKSDQTIKDHTMELLDKQNVKADIITYRFSTTEDTMPKVPSLAPRVRQILPTVCASLSCLPFGLMLGWPSPTNPILMGEDSPIPISIDQSAMIAGFLMIGNALGATHSHKIIYKAKFGILAGAIVMTIGWILMWHAKNIFWLLGSRLLVGLGSAYGTGQLKLYISHTCDRDLKVIQTKFISLYVYLGIVMVYAIGPFIDFRDTSMVCLLVSIAVVFLVIFLPATPVELVKDSKFNEARRVIARLKSNVNINSEISAISRSIEKKVKERNLLHIFKEPDLRNKFVVFSIIVFCQQFSGLPATIIYTQILFQEFRFPYPEYLAIAYVVIFFICNVIGIFLMPRFDKRKVLLCSTISVILILTTQILVIYFEVNDKYWSFTSFVVMCLYVIAHTLGLGNVPPTLINDLFTIPYRTSVANFFTAFHSILALLITKIFQVLISQYDIAVTFYLFLCVSVFALVFIYFAAPNEAQCNNDVEIKCKPTT
ncbi:unnamed protein product [Phyllotreta striolata]|uniref:Facilitated trehalose transporter Tret1-like n=1 Tax=Phyllotreta striolata TaxID=444603 RepID=A0A9P0DRD9_PHYSR|nr:unnamed protein product [Phyllotreta striolata]